MVPLEILKHASSNSWSKQATHLTGPFAGQRSPEPTVAAPERTERSVSLLRSVRPCVDSPSGPDRAGTTRFRAANDEERSKRTGRSTEVFL